MDPNADYGSLDATKPVDIPQDEEQQQQPDVAPDVSCIDEITDIKWRILIAICLLTFGGYYIYDFPGAIGSGKTNSIMSRFQAEGKQYTHEQNQALYSVYSWPNTVVATIGGILIDNVMGLRKSLMLFVTLVTIGSAIFYIGVQFTSYPVMILGRFVFGLGNESLSVAQNSFVARFFRGKYGIALAFGIVLSFSRVGSSFNFLFSPRFAEDVSVEFAVLVGVFACCLSVVASLILVFVDLWAERNNVVPLEKIKRDDAGGFSFTCNDIKVLNARFWLICIICITVYCSVFPFVGIGKNFFEVKYDVSQTQGATYVSFFQFACAGFSPFTGFFVDGAGRTVIWMMVAGGGFTLIHLLFLVASPQPVAMTIVMGVFYSILASSLWPAVPFVVPPAAVGLAYGLMNSLQNCGLAVYPLIVGAILDGQTPPRPTPIGLCANWTRDDFQEKYLASFSPMELVNCTNNTDQPLPYLEGYEQNAILFMATAALGVVVGAVLLYLDTKSDNILIANAADRKVIFADRLAAWKLEEASLKATAAPSDEKTGLLNDSLPPSGSPSGALANASFHDQVKK